MGLTQALLPEFEHEAAITRKCLERVPDEKLGWKPHDKSMTLARLAGHLAEIPSWVGVTLGQDSFDYMPPGAPPYEPHIPASAAEIVETFDKNVKAAREAIAAASDEQLLQNWSLLAGGKTLFTMPRAAVLRGMVMSHSVHHRGQLAVYLRLNDIPVPSIYGPSADEGI